MTDDDNCQLVEAILREKYPLLYKKSKVVKNEDEIARKEISSARKLPGNFHFLT